MMKIQRALRLLQSMAVLSVVVVTLNVLGTGGLTASALTNSPPCEGTNLVGAFVSNQVATGHVMTTIAVTNVGTSTCKLGGYPTIIGLRGTNRYALHITGHGTFGGNLRPTVLAPRMSGALIIGTGDLCAPYYGVNPPGHSYTGVILRLPRGGGTVNVPDVSVNTSCGLVESQLGWRKGFSIQGV